MKILQRAGQFEIQETVAQLRDQLSRIEKAGRTCYQSEKQPVTYESAERFITMLLKRGHHSVLEHSKLTVKFTGVSRGFTHEMVRHRLCAFSQESTRYVDYKQFEVVAPPHRDTHIPIDLPNGMRLSFETMCFIIENCYKGLREAGWAPEDARQILPNGITSNIVVSANFREWRHIFDMRTSKPAHWEIREVMCALLAYLKGVIPVVFQDFHFIANDANGVGYYERRPL